MKTGEEAGPIGRGPIEFCDFSIVVLELWPVECGKAREGVDCVGLTWMVGD